MFSNPPFLLGTLFQKSDTTVVQQMENFGTSHLSNSLYLSFSFRVLLTDQSEHHSGPIMKNCLSPIIISVIHTDRIYLSPFTKDIRVWVTLKRSQKFHL